MLEVHISWKSKRTSLTILRWAYIYNCYWSIVLNLSWSKCFSPRDDLFRNSRHGRIYGKFEVVSQFPDLIEIVYFIDYKCVWRYLSVAERHFKGYSSLPTGIRQDNFSSRRAILTIEILRDKFHIASSWIVSHHRYVLTWICSRDEV